MATKKVNLGGRQISCDDGVVRTLVDATYALSVLTIQEDNDRGVCGNPASCAISQAIIRYFASRGQKVGVSIGADKAFVQSGNKIYRWQLPPNVGR